MADFKSRFLRIWIILLIVCMGAVFAYRYVSKRHVPFTKGAHAIWRTGKIPTGSPETLTFSKLFVYPKQALCMKFYLHAFPSYILYVNGSRAGNGWAGDHLYDLSPLLNRGTNEIQVVIPSKDGFGFLVCSASMDGVGSGLLSSGKDWTLTGEEGACEIRLLGSPPAAHLGVFHNPKTMDLFPTYAGGAPLYPAATENYPDGVLYDFGRSLLAYPIVEGESLLFSWGEEKVTAQQIPAVVAGNFPGMNSWTTPQALNLRYIMIRSEEEVSVRLQPVTGPYPP